MKRVQLSLFANLAGKGWTALMALAFVPWYISLMGIEAYGLVGFYVTLQAVFSLLDIGLSTTLNRELARASNSEELQRARDLVRTFEYIYWGMALLVGALVIGLAPLIAERWISAVQLDTATIRSAILIMGITLSVQWPISLYSGGLLGLQRPLVLNSIAIVAATLRGLGSVLVLLFIAPTVQAFFIWQIVVAGLQTSALGWFLWRSLPGSERRPQFQLPLLRSIWRFAAGMSAISVVSLLLMQLDKVVLSRLLSLELFGYYALATVVASGVNYISYPIFQTFFPGLAAAVARQDEAAVVRIYHQSCQAMALLVLPISCVLAFFAQEILAIWTHNPQTTQNTHGLVSILVAGMALNGLVSMPYALQLAYGWTKLALYQNGIGVVLLVPLLIILTQLYGAVGAATIWPLLNTGYMLISVPIMHGKFLPNELWPWYGQDIALPGVLTLLLVGLGRWLMPPNMPWLGTLGYLGIVLAGTSLVVALVMPTTRVMLRRLLAQRLWRRSAVANP
jgi:O-antigen/teichoic acid export membrane protein